MSDFLGPTLLDVVGDELVHYLEYLLAAVADADVAFERFLAADAEVGVMEHIGWKCAGELLIGFPDCVFLNHQLSIGTFGEDASSEKFALGQSCQRDRCDFGERAEIGELRDADVGRVARFVGALAFEYGAVDSHAWHLCHHLVAISFFVYS